MSSWEICGEEEELLFDYIFTLFSLAPIFNNDLGKLIEVIVDFEG